jgi:myo-inositol-1(or 4)-monophosphatase
VKACSNAVENPGRAGHLHLSHELEVISQLALHAGAVLRQYQSKHLTVVFKDRGEIVTNADVESNSIICEGLRVAFPQDLIISEEGAHQASEGSNSRVWFIDPLDSTSNYVQGGSEYVISIGLAVEEEPVLGVIYNPVREELFAGHIGSGVSLNRIPVRTTYLSVSRQAHVLVSKKEWDRGINRVANNLQLKPMSSMAYKLARVSAGMADGVISLKNRKPWGTCAGVALVEAAGGCVTSLHGGPLLYSGNHQVFAGLVASGQHFHPSLLRTAQSLAGDAGLCA